MKLKDAATECPAPECPRDRVPVRLSAQWSLSAQRPKINSNQTEGWSQTIAARPEEFEKEIWFKKSFLMGLG